MNFLALARTTPLISACAPKVVNFSLSLSLSLHHLANVINGKFALLARPHASDRARRSKQGASYALRAPLPIDREIVRVAMVNHALAQPFPKGCTLHLLRQRAVIVFYKQSREEESDPSL